MVVLIADRDLPLLLAHVVCRLLPADLLPAGGVTLLQPHSAAAAAHQPAHSSYVHTTAAQVRSLEEDTRGTTPAAPCMHAARVSVRSSSCR